MAKSKLKNYMFFPKDEKNKTLEKHIVRRAAKNIAAARDIAAGLLRIHGNRYCKIIIAEVTFKDTVRKSFKL